MEVNAGGVARLARATGEMDEVRKRMNENVSEYDEERSDLYLATVRPAMAAARYVRATGKVTKDADGGDEFSTGEGAAVTNSALRGGVDKTGEGARRVDYTGATAAATTKDVGSVSTEIATAGTSNAGSAQSALTACTDGDGSGELAAMVDAVASIEPTVTK
ncbi:hypothetical protein P3T76_007387 [Phytophthora citrophthora]|uniref:Uncharacterized protein n=1 Tax=Phytophthora citrophthora TaxID=4793 RepID=A0AAD9GP81_9STRA|nr:hypothetical protein P3T76_007387 [Phytophthora citrophthora]